MTGRAQRDAHNPHDDPDQLEVVEGTAHQNVEGWVPELASETDVRDVLTRVEAEEVDAIEDPDDSHESHDQKDATSIFEERRRVLK